MDKLTRYRNSIMQLLRERAETINRHSTTGLETHCVFDEIRDHYLLITVGWSNRQRIRGASIYVRLRDNKFWIEEDMTEEGIATQLLKAGVPSDDIVLAFQAPEMRRYTEFAVA